MLTDLRAVVPPEIEAGSADGPAHHFDEAARLDALRSYKILDTQPEVAFDRIVELARVLFETPIALVSFVDRSRQWFKARAGLDLLETPREVAFCDHVIREPDVMVVPDARLDARFVDNPLVTSGPMIRFYAGAPMITPEGARLGAVCIVSPEPRADLSEPDRRRLAALAGIATNELELRRKTAQAERLALDKEILAIEIENRVKNTLHFVNRVLEAQAIRVEDRQVRQFLYEAVDRISGIEVVQRHLRHGAAVFDGDARAYLLSLVANLQETLIDQDDGRTITVTGGEDLLVAPDCMAALGMVTAELVTNALKHGRGDVEIHLTGEAGALVLCVRDHGRGFLMDNPGGLSGGHVGLRLVEMLALPDSLMVDPSCPQRITVRLAA